MTDHVEVREVVHMSRHGRAVDLVELADEFHEIGSRTVDVVAGGVEFGAVAGRQHDRFASRAAARERSKGRLDAALEIDLLAQLDGRGPMIDSDHQQVHRLRNYGSLSGSS